MQAEAERVARRYWAMRITNCGTYTATKRSFGPPLMEQQYFLKDYSKQRKMVYIQIRYDNPKRWSAIGVSVPSIMLINGIWQGYSKIGFFSQSRISYDGTHWGSWTEMSPSFERELTVNMQKKDGKWYFSQEPKLYTKSKCF